MDNSNRRIDVKISILRIDVEISNRRIDVGTLNLRKADTVYIPI